MHMCIFTVMKRLVVTALTSAKLLELLAQVLFFGTLIHVWGALKKGRAAAPLKAFSGLEAAVTELGDFMHFLVSAHALH